MRGTTLTIIMIIMLLFGVGLYAFYSAIVTGSLVPRRVLDSWNRRANLLNGKIPQIVFSVGKLSNREEVMKRLNSLPSSEFKQKIIDRGDLQAHVLDRSIYNTFVRYQSGRLSLDDDTSVQQNSEKSDSIVISSYLSLLNGYENLILSGCKQHVVNQDVSRHICSLTSNLKKESNANLACVILSEKGPFSAHIHTDIDACWTGKDAKSVGAVRISYFGEGSFSSLIISLFSVFVVLTFGGVMIFIGAFSIFLYVFLRINLFDLKIDQT